MIPSLEQMIKMMPPHAMANSKLLHYYTHALKWTSQLGVQCDRISDINYVFCKYNSLVIQGIWTHSGCSGSRSGLHAKKYDIFQLAVF